jgi:acyl carrier protein
MSPEWTGAFEKVLREHLPLLAPDHPLTSGAKLAQLGLDSLGTVQLLISLEDEFQVSIPDEMLTPAVFATPDAIWAALDELMQN